MQFFRAKGDTMVKRRNSRQDAIRDIVRAKSIHTQRSLVEELQDIGYNCTQATVSRDIADMGLNAYATKSILGEAL